MESVSQEQVSSVLGLLQALVGLDNEPRRLAEAEIFRLIEGCPDQLLVCLLHILQYTAEVSPKQAALVILQKILSGNSIFGSKKLSQVSSGIQQLLQVKLVDLVKTETTYVVKKKYAAIM